MSNGSTKSTMVSFRLRNETRDKILLAINSQLNHNTSVSDYCKEVIERYAWRHSK
jgi:hypothetical protein